MVEAHYATVFRAYKAITRTSAGLLGGFKMITLGLQHDVVASWSQVIFAPVSLTLRQSWLCASAESYKQDIQQREDTKGKMDGK